MSGLRSKLKNAVQVALDLLLPINYNGRWRNPESRATQFGRRWGTTVDREKWDDYRKGNGDRLY